MNAGSPSPVAPSSFSPRRPRQPHRLRQRHLQRQPHRLRQRHPPHQRHQLRQPHRLRPPHQLRQPDRLRPLRPRDPLRRPCQQRQHDLQRRRSYRPCLPCCRRPSYRRRMLPQQQSPTS